MVFIDLLVALLPAAIGLVCVGAASLALVVFVSLALLLTDAGQQLRAVAVAAMTAFGVALAGAAAAGAVLTRRISNRVDAIAEVAARYQRGNLAPSRLDFGDDELGVVARTLDDAVQQLGRQLDELTRDRARMQAILAGMIEGVLVVDPSGRVQLANQAARSMLSFEDTWQGRPYVEAVRHPAISSLVSAALAGQPSATVEISPPRDATRTLMARAAPVTPGSSHGAMLVLHDITDLRRADRMRRDFVANVSHELRTPLTAVRGYVEALQEPDIVVEDRRRFLDIIGRHAHRMEHLVKDLLRLARLDAGQETVEIVPCSTRSLVQTVVGDLVPMLDSRGQHVSVAVEAGAESVRADPSKLHDVLRNLIANASTYAPADTTIGVTAGPEAPGRVTIAVNDRGPGIPDEDLSRIFERFYRVEKSRARDPGGTGLGLSIVKHLVELQGGTVYAQNRATGGARFVVTLPSGG